MGKWDKLMVLVDKILGWLSNPQNRPSWMSSSLSQVFVLAATSYLIVAAKTAWATGDFTHIKWGAEVFGVVYIAKRFGENGRPPTPGAPSPSG